MIQVATFDILPTDAIFPTFFPSLPEDDPFNDKFDRLQIGSRYLVMNMGTMLVILAFYVALYMLYPCLVFLKNDAKCAAKLRPKIHKMIFWNHSILFIQEGFLDILIAGAVNLFFLHQGTLEWNSYSLIFTNLLAIFLVSCCGLLFILIVGYLLPNFDQLKSKRIKRRFYPAYEMLNLKNGRWTFLWPVFFIARRVLFVVGVCALVNYASMQLIMFIMPTLAVMMLLALVKPLEDNAANKIETYNSFMILMMTYCLMCFTPLALDEIARYTMGYVMVFLTTKNIVVNIYVVSRAPVR